MITITYTSSSCNGLSPFSDNFFFLHCHELRDITINWGRWPQSEMWATGEKLTICFSWAFIIFHIFLCHIFFSSLPPNWTYIIFHCRTVRYVMTFWYFILLCCAYRWIVPHCHLHTGLVSSARLQGSSQDRKVKDLCSKTQLNAAKHWPNMVRFQWILETGDGWKSGCSPSKISDLGENKDLSENHRYRISWMTCNNLRNIKW